MKKRRYLNLFVSILAVAMILTGCGAASETMDMAFNSSSVTNSSMKSESSSPQISYDAGFDSAMVEEAVEYEQPPESEGPGEMTGESSVQATDRKLIKTVDMNVETKEFDSLLVTLENRVEELGGYIERMESYNGSTYSGYRGNRDASMTIRIPPDKLNGFLDEVSDICNVIRKSEQVEDVTLTYVDLESHKRVLEAEQERLLELIDRAEAIEEIITIESRLSEVRYQLESMESQLRTFDNRINYSTITLYVEEVRELTPVAEETMWERITGGFVESIRDIGDDLQEFVIWFLINIPYFVLWIVLLTIIIVVIRWLDKVLKKRRAKKQQNQAQQIGAAEDKSELK